MPARNPKRFHLIASLTISFVSAATIWYFLGAKQAWPALLLSWLVAVNLVGFLYYGYDKARSQSENGRIPEVVLHTLSALGGSLGAWLGMTAFRHKTVKGSFRILFWSIVILQALLVAWIVKAWWFS